MTAPKVWIRGTGSYRTTNSALLTLDEAFELLEGKLAEQIAQELRDEATNYANHKKNLARAKKLGITL